MCVNNDDDPSVLKVVSSYFPRPEPARYEGDGDYAVAAARLTSPSYEWTHSLGEIVTALATAGLRIERLHEFPCCDYEYLRNMRRDEHGWWWLPDDMFRIPHTYSIKATR
jgi:hypothetical protein